MSNPLEVDKLKNLKVKIHEPFAEYLMSNAEEYSFDLSLLDAIHLAGHACPAIIGAFLITQAAIDQLFDNKICIRGDVEIATSSSSQTGATGPMTNVMSFITGAWAESGFGGLGGDFRRRNLLKYNSMDVPKRAYRFKRISTGKVFDIFYLPELIESETELPFPLSWRFKINRILENPQKVIECYMIK